VRSLVFLLFDAAIPVALFASAIQRPTRVLYSAWLRLPVHRLRDEAVGDPNSVMKFERRGSTVCARCDPVNPRRILLVDKACRGGGRANTRQRLASAFVPNPIVNLFPKAGPRQNSTLARHLPNSNLQNRNISASPKMLEVAKM
jgi:hypothetical protein